MTKQEEKFVNAVRAMEKRTARVSAFVVIDPARPDSSGRYVISYPADGTGRVHCIAWLPGVLAPDTGNHYVRHHGWASGGGYDKATAAMGGAPFYNLKTGQMDKLQDQGYSHRQQLEAAGYIVIQAC